MRPSKLKTAQENMESTLNKMWFHWPVLLASHFLMAVVGAMFIGFIPEVVLGRLYYNSGLEPYSPAIALSALLLGYFVSSRVLSVRAARWTWTLGALWLLVGVHELTTSWNGSWSPEKTRWGYALANLVGSTRRCSGSECLYEFFFTTPFAATVMYSVGAYLANRGNPEFANFGSLREFSILHRSGSNFSGSEKNLASRCMSHWLITMLARAGIQYPPISTSLITVRARLHVGG